MAKALLGYLPGGDPRAAQLALENAALRSRVERLTEQIEHLEEALSASNAVADARLVDLVAEPVIDIAVPHREVPSRV